MDPLWSGHLLQGILVSGLQLLLETTVKATLLLMIAGALTWSLRFCSAAARHAIWCVAVLGLVSLPWAIAIAPDWHVSLPWKNPQLSNRPTDGQQTTIRADVEPPTVIFSLPEKASITVSETSAAFVTDGASQGAAAWSAMELAAVAVCLLWAVGALMMALRLICGVLRLRRLAAKCTPIQDALWQSDLQLLSRELGRRKNVSLFSSHWTTVPLTWQAFRAAIVLPADFATWTSERRRIVLLHELGHVVRRDCLIQYLAQLACACYWYHPLVWLAVRRLYAEREQACDDVVLGRGVRPSEYAAELIEMVSTSCSPGPILAVRMGGAGRTEARVRAILDRSRGRRPLSAPVRLMGGLVGTLFVFCLATVCGKEQSAEANAMDGVAWQPPNAATSGPQVPQAATQTTATQPSADPREDRVAAAISQGLHFLSGQQQEDGSFARNGHGRNVGVGALAAQALLNADETAGVNAHAPQIDKFIRFLLTNADNRGLLLARDEPYTSAPMYGHGFATGFLSRAYSASRREPLLRGLTAAVELIVKSQHKSGSWRYLPVAPGDGDISVTSCQLLALAAARQAGIEIPQATLDRGVQFVKRCQNQNGGFRYLRDGGGPSAAPRSAAALAVLFALDDPAAPETQRALTYALAQLPGAARGPNDPVFFLYEQYYAAQVMRKAGGAASARWRQSITEQLLDSQRADGSWPDTVGPIYGTALACLILQGLPKAEEPRGDASSMPVQPNAVFDAEIEPGWGHLKGRFIYDGPAPAPGRIVMTPPIANQPLTDESLLVDAETSGIANVVVYLRTKAVAVHPAYQQFSPAVKLTLAGGRVRPHIASIRLDQRLRIQNLDAVAYNLNLAPLLDKADNPLLPPGNVFERPAFKRSQTIPQPISCNIHPWLKSYILPRDNPYVAITDDREGRFEIRNLPAGELEFQIWHERVGYLAAKPEWRTGKFKLTIVSGQTADLGAVHVDPQLFQRK